MGTPTHGPASACSEMSIAALVLAKHERTGLVRAMRGEGGLALAGMAKKASGGRLFSPLFSNLGSRRPHHGASGQMPRVGGGLVDTS